MPAGRPTKYKKEYCQKIRDFFNRDYKQKVKGSSQYEACDFPSLARFSIEIGVHIDTIYEWEKKHPEFSEALTFCRKMQEDIIINNSLKGGYNSSFAQFLMKNNFGYRDRQEQDINITEFNFVGDNDGE